MQEEIITAVIDYSLLIQTNGQLGLFPPDFHIILKQLENKGYYRLLIVLGSNVQYPIFSLFCQIVFFSFCRGGLRAPKKPKASRSYNSWELTILPGLMDSCDFEPVPNQLRSGERAREWQIHPFPAVVLPTQVFAIYSTLEDSK